MFCIIGLGNPGKQYEQTRHNAGFLVIDALTGELGPVTLKNGFKSHFGQGSFEGHKLLLVKPQTFMNLSGEAVIEVLRFYRIELPKLLVIYDDLDLPLGAIRLKMAGSSGGHKGLASIEKLLGTNKIPRLRVGIGRPDPGVAVVDYVLSGFKDQDYQVFQESVKRAAAAVKNYIVNGPEDTMNHFNKTRSGQKES